MFFLLLFVALGLTAAAQPAAKPLPLPPPCQLNTAPVNPSRRPVAGELPLVTTAPAVVTMQFRNTIGIAEKKCLLATGIALFCGGSASAPTKCWVAVCGNEFVGTVAVQPPQTSLAPDFSKLVKEESDIPISEIRVKFDGEIEVGGEVKVNHVGTVVHDVRHSGTIEHKIVPPPTPAAKPAAPKKSRCGRGCKIAIGILAGGGAGAGIYFGTRGNGSTGPAQRGPGARTGPAF
jgi:hypothetical protein